MARGLFFFVALLAVVFAVANGYCWTTRQLTMNAGGAWNFYLGTCTNTPTLIYHNHTVRSVNDDKYEIRHGANLCGTDHSDDDYFVYGTAFSYEGNFENSNEKTSRPASHNSYFAKTQVFCANRLFACAIEVEICMEYLDNTTDAKPFDASVFVGVNAEEFA